MPFPFAEFPPAVEPEAWQVSETESKALGMPSREMQDLDLED